jgi:glutathione synthase/RimK-type ligase-like ATP-grasp enzyme
VGDLTVGLATCEELPDLDADDRPLVTALAVHGIQATPVVWDDPAVDWGAYALVVLRSTWDYAERHEAFLDWARSLSAVVNPVPVLEWGVDKERYLGDLDRAGVPVVPTSFVHPGEELPPLEEPFVVKPAISAGGRMSARFEPANLEAASALLARIHAADRAAMVQPLCEGDEHSIVFIDGVYSHALARRAPLPALREREGLYLQEQLSRARETPRERARADAAIGVAPAPLLYARVDLIGGLVLEVEVVEPSLYLAFGSGALERFAAAIAAATLTACP